MAPFHKVIVRKVIVRKVIVRKVIVRKVPSPPTSIAYWSSRSTCTLVPSSGSGHKLDNCALVWRWGRRNALQRHVIG